MSVRAMPALLGLLLFSACGGNGTIAPHDGGGTPLVSAMVGPAGGGLEIPGMMALGIPAGALTEMTEVSVFMEDSPPEGFTEVMGPVLRFEPSGLTFAEPLLINIEYPPTFAGRLWWSREDGSGFDPIGSIEFGKARAFVTHFSTAFGSGEGCEDTLEDNNQICYCWGPIADGVEVALCPREPMGSGSPYHCGFDLDDTCPDRLNDASGNPQWRGREGDSCTGYDRPTEVVTRCNCVGTSGPATGLSLCANPFDFSGGMMLCPCGIINFKGEEGPDCNGYYVAYGPAPDYVRRNESASGRMNLSDPDDCAPMTVWADRYTSISGHMLDCVPEGPVDPPTYPDYGGDTLPEGFPAGMEAPAASPSTSCAPPMGPPPMGPPP